MLDYKSIEKTLQQTAYNHPLIPATMVALSYHWAKRDNIETTLPTTTATPTLVFELKLNASDDATNAFSVIDLATISPSYYQSWTTASPGSIDPEADTSSMPALTTGLSELSPDSNLTFPNQSSTVPAGSFTTAAVPTLVAFNGSETAVNGANGNSAGSLPLLIVIYRAVFGN